MSQNHNVRLFGHTWKVSESSTQSWWKNEQERNLSNPENEIDFVNNLNWTKLLIEEEIEINHKYDKFNSHISYNGVNSMFYGWKKVNELYSEYKNSQNWKADLVIKLRYDIDFNIDRILDVVKSTSDNIYVNRSHIFELAKSYSDIIFIGRETELNFSLALEKFNSNFFLKTYFKKYNLFIPEIFVSNFIFESSKINCVDFELVIVRDENTRVNIFESKLLLDKFFVSENKKFLSSIKAGVLNKCKRIINQKMSSFILKIGRRIKRL